MISHSLTVLMPSYYPSVKELVLSDSKGLQATMLTLQGGEEEKDQQQFRQ